MSRKWIYLTSLLVLICLVSGAFFAPGLVMEYRDRALLENYTFQPRTGIDYEAVNTQYTMSREERMAAFAKGIQEGRQYYITSSGEEVASWSELLGGIYSEFFFNALYAADIDIWMLEGIYDPNSVKEYQYYVIYDDDMTNGAAFLCWYLEIELSGIFLRLLVDAKDYSVYYLEYYEEDSTGYPADWIGWIYYERYDYGIIPNLRDYFGCTQELYYTEAYQKILEANGIDSVGSLTKEEDKKSYIINKSKETDGEINSGASSETEGYVRGDYLDDEWKEIVAGLLYEEGSLSLDICLLNQRQGPGDYGFRIGIQELFELLPQEVRGTKLDSVG